jgi:micrococcal nuclease
MLLLLVAALRWWFGAPPPAVGGASGALAPGVYEVERVVDGDTLLLRQDRMRVRLQGVDTPETVKENSPVEPFGPEAAAYTKAFVAAAGGRLRMEVDGETMDQHGRYLAFAWHGERMLNEELVRTGLARALLQYDYGDGKKQRLRRAQRDAQRAGSGIWSR